MKGPRGSTALPINSSVILLMMKGNVHQFSYLHSCLCEGAVGSAWGLAATPWVAGDHLEVLLLGDMHMTVSLLGKWVLFRLLATFHFIQVFISFK